MKSFDIHLVPTFGISVGEEELDTTRANCLEMWRLKGQVQINKVFNGLFYHKASFGPVLSVWSTAVEEASELTDTRACERLKEEERPV